MAAVCRCGGKVGTARRGFRAVDGDTFAASGMEPMEDQDLEPLHTKPKPKDLEAMSIEALKEYIAGLEAEIARANAAIAAKEKHRSAADAVFRK